ncbi:MAG TPA: BlaI/MecI/CopY family transcriptional regulator [Bryobacteraceae bacterium]|jgi:predicted transcriptional regulator
MRNAKSGSELPELGKLERQVMDLVWLHGPSSAEDVRARLDRPLRESTVRTVLRRLEDKRFVTHEVENRTYIYRAREARAHVAAKAVKRIADWFCQGSVEELLTGMVDADVLDGAELRRLAARIAKAKGGGK